MKIDTSQAIYSSQMRVPTIKKGGSDASLRAQTDKFEALLVKILLDASMKDVNPLYGKSAGNNIYKSMYKEQVANMSGGSFGISQLLFNFLKANN